MKISCPQCGADFNIPSDAPFIKCSFCSVSLYIDGGKGLKHYMSKPRLDERNARDALQSFFSNRNIPYSSGKIRGILLPFFLITGKDTQKSMPAFSSRVNEFYRYNIPSASYLQDNEELKGFERTPASLSVDEIKEVSHEVKEINLYEVPFYEISNIDYTVYIDAITGNAVIEHQSIRAQSKKPLLSASLFIVLSLIIIVTVLLTKSIPISLVIAFVSSIIGYFLATGEGKEPTLSNTDRGKQRKE